MSGTPIPFHRLKKDELMWLAQHTCKAHGVSYISHYNCWIRECEEERKIGFFDIESTDLNAGFGIMLSFSIKEGGRKEIISDVITETDMRKGVKGDEDKRIVRRCIQELSQFDVIVTHYGNDYRFDVPFVRTRALAMNIPFPAYGALKHYDTYAMLKKKFRLPRNRLETACRILIGATEKTHLDPVIWRKAARGDKKSLAYILEHNKRDVRDLERLYNKIERYVRQPSTSI